MKNSSGRFNTIDMRVAIFKTMFFWVNFYWVRFQGLAGGKLYINIHRTDKSSIRKVQVYTFHIETH